MSLRRSKFGGWVAVVIAVAIPVAAQYPGQIAKPDISKPMLRAVAVLEWTGDEQHPKASRLIPVTVYDGQQLQDGGIYLAQPEPLSLEGEVEYQLKDDGKNVGLFVVNNAGQEQGSWVGFGTWKPLPKPKPIQPPAKIDAGVDENSDEPVLHRKAHLGDASGSSSSGSGSASQGPPPDPDRPTLHREADSGGDSASGDSGSGGSPPDPDRPTLHKSPESSSGGDSAAAAGPGTDPDRPTLTRKPDAAKSDSDEGAVSSVADSTDPDRPKLVRGKSDYSGDAVLPSLIGVPVDMKQAVAVSDARNTPEHIWSFSWTNPDDEAKYRAELEDQARTALGLNPPPAPAAKKTRTAAVHTAKTAMPAPPPAPLLVDQYRVFELAYGSGATMVLSAHTNDVGAQEKFVTLIAQPDLYGNLAILFKNVTDAAHLDETPRMRLVDAVDAMADNRGELLFELRGAMQRQFALYRVLRGQATQVFVSGGRELVAASQ